MTTQPKAHTLSARAKLGLALAAALPLLAACDGIDALSDTTARAAYRTNFTQLPLIASSGAPGRVLQMHIFQGTNGHIPRSSRKIPFHAELSP